MSEFSDLKSDEHAILAKSLCFFVVPRTQAIDVARASAIELFFEFFSDDEPFRETLTTPLVSFYLLKAGAVVEVSTQEAKYLYLGTVVGKCL